MNTEFPADNDAFLDLQRLVSARLGLNLSRRNDRSIADIFNRQLARLRIPSLREYQARLEAEREDGPLWRELIDELTIAETYFFRDQGQMELLRTEVLPDLLQEAQGRMLRIWSAGCSSGEEPYSIAILLDELRPGGPPGQVEITGTDVSALVLEQARKAVYRERSLRSTPALTRQLYFQKKGRDWELLSRIRKKVSFWSDNLARPTGPARSGIDLIVCRNVLIYFERHQIASILARFTNALRPGGYLLTGHGELQGIEKHQLDTCNFKHSLIYRRTNQFALMSQAPTAPPPGRLLVPLPQPSAPPSWPDEALDFAGRLREAMQRGDLETARELCRRAAIEQPLAATPRLMEAHIARRQGKLERARELLQQALYLEPESPWIFLELALFWAASDEKDRARKMRSAALELKEKAPGAAPPGLSFEDTLEELERRLGGGLSL
jgi:chemotaxis protein methyltransferase CheR